MERIWPKGNVLMVNNWLRELALEYGLKDYVIRGHCTHGIYTAVLRWHHTVKDDIANIAVAVTLKTLDTEPWMDTYKNAQSALRMKRQRCRQAFVGIITECGAIQ